MSQRTRRWFILSAAISAGITQVSHAQFVWNGGGAPNLSFSVGANWIGGVAPSSGASLAFDGTNGLTPFNNLVGTSFSGISFPNSGTGPFVIGGNSFSLGGTINDNDGTNIQTINNSMTLTGNRTVTVTSG